GVKAEHLVVDVAAARVRRDHEPGHAQAVAVDGHLRRHHVVVEAAPVVPGEEDCGRAPVRAAHDRVDDTGDVGLAGRDEARRGVPGAGCGARATTSQAHRATV